MTYSEKISFLWRDFKRDFHRLKYNIIYGMKNLIRWFPVIWADRDWDYYYLLVMLERKLAYMQKDIQNSAHMEAERDVADIQTCLDIIKKVKNDTYTDETYSAIEAKYGELKMRFNDNKTIDFWNVKAENNPEMQAEANALLREMTISADKQKEADLAILAEIIQKRLLYWWT